MTMTIGMINTKGGSCKTTTSANLGGLLAGRGHRVLLVDADRQPSLSKYYSLVKQAESGVSKFIVQADGDQSVISKTTIETLDLIYSDIEKHKLEQWIVDRPDGRFRLNRAIDQISNFYDYIIIDTRGADGPLTDMTIMASDLTLTPIPPDKLSSSEISTTIKAIERGKDAASTVGIETGPMFWFICRKDRSRDSDIVEASIRRALSKLADKKPFVVSLDTVVPSTQAYRSAATQRLPVHLFEPTSPNISGSAAAVMNTLLDEILMKYEYFPNSKD